MVSELVATQFLQAISQSTGYLCADESRRQLWRQTRWLFLSRQLLSIWWWLLSQQGVYAHTNPSISWGSIFGEDFKRVSNSVLDVDFLVSWDCVRCQSRRQLRRESRWWFMSLQLLSFRWRLSTQHGLCAQTKPSVSWGSSFVDDFRALSDSFFGGDFRVKWDFVR